MALAYALVTLVALATVAGCSDRSAAASVPVATVASDEPEPRRSPDPPASVPLPNEGVDERISLRGRAVTRSGVAVPGIVVVTVDRTGDRRESVTGGLGEISVEELLPPYDLRVGDVAYLGVSRADPVIEVPREEPFFVETVSVEVRAPPCGREVCIVDVVSTSLTGEGAATVSGTGWVTVQHASRRREPIDVHALVHDAAFSAVAYGRGRGVIEAGRVETREIAFERAAGDADETVTLDVPGAHGVPGASFAIDRRIPLVVGASWRIERRAVAPPTATLIHRSSRAWSGAQALERDPPALPLPIGPEIERPLGAGELSARGAGLSWSPDPRTLFTVDVADVARGVFRYRIVTNASDLPFRRIEALGFPRLRPGAHTLSLTTAPLTDVDEAVSSDVTERRLRFDERRGGAATYETIPFTAIP